MKKLRELAPQEQVRMSVDEAGKPYNGYFIFFTNSEDVYENGKNKFHAIPLVISLTQQEFFDSKLFDKYRDRSMYGIPYTCSAYMDEDNFPPVLSQ